MDNFKAFQLTDEEAMMVVGSSKRRGGRKKRFLSTLSEEDKTAITTAITELKSSDGWADLSREDRWTQLKDIFAPYKEEG